MKNLTVIASTIALSIASFGAAAQSADRLSAESSWDDIRAAHNITLSNHTVKVGNLRTSVFNVEHQGGELYTTFQSGDYKLENSQGRVGMDSYGYSKVGYSQKSGPVDISLGEYKLVKTSMDDQDLIKTGERTYSQPLTRTIKVYNIKRNSQGDFVRTYLFDKDFTIPAAMEVAQITDAE